MMSGIVTEDAKEQLKLEAKIAAETDMYASYIHIYSEEDLKGQKPFGIDINVILTIDPITEKVSKN